MGLFDKIKKGFKSAMAYAQMDDFLIKKIDEMICERWEKVSQRTPTNIGGVSLEEEAEYLFVYNTPAGEVHVEMEHEWPELELEMNTPTEKFEVKIMVSDFVEKDGTEMTLINSAQLSDIVRDMMDMAVS
ncbi:MAG: hypothetical protein MI802_15370 [Desulfobacterales bacterium]|nr:hypothetical protein [Desulfobacterales bacterium]